MRLNELISFVREIQIRPDVGDRGTRDEPLLDEPNAPYLQERPGVPPWMPGQAITPTVRDREGLVLQVEAGFSPDALPDDLRRPDLPIDTLAYYLPFHLHGDWGIYLREGGLLAVASILKGSPLSPGDSALIACGHRLLLDHEFTHFQAEVACARAEVVVKRRLYDGYFHDGFAAAHEESLANASAFRGLRREPTPLQERVAKWMKRQGPGYRDFERWVRYGTFAEGCRRASQHMLKSLSAARASRPEPAEFLFDSVRRFKPPVYMVLDVSLASTLKPFPKAHGMRVLVHTRDHPPPHIHIEIPPGRAFTRYEWPVLQPLKGDASLSSVERRSLDAYIEEYGPEIDRKVRTVYPHVAPWETAPSPAA
jgi:hypothetical protein